MMDPLPREKTKEQGTPFKCPRGSQNADRFRLFAVVGGGGGGVIFRARSLAAFSSSLRTNININTRYYYY